MDNMNAIFRVLGHGKQATKAAPAKAVKPSKKADNSSALCVTKSSKDGFICCDKPCGDCPKSCDMCDKTCKTTCPDMKGVKAHMDTKMGDVEKGEPKDNEQVEGE